MSKKPNDETKDQKDLDATNKPLDWAHWNRIPVLTLQQAILLTLNAEPRSYISMADMSTFYPSRYQELLDIAQAHILDGSLKYLSQSVKKLRAVDWLQWLQKTDLPIPGGWQPVGFECPATESIKNANMYEARYRSHYTEAVNIAIAMAESEKLPTPTKLKQLYGYMENNPNDCPVNYGAGKKPKIATVEKNVRNGGGNPLQDPRFHEVLAQNP